MSVTNNSFLEATNAWRKYQEYLQESCQYMHAEWVNDEYRSIRIEELYCKQTVSKKQSIDITSLTSFSSDEFLRFLRKRAIDTLSTNDSTVRKEMCDSQNADLRPNKSFVILEGRPGGGKSTWCKRVCIAILQEDNELLRQLTEIPWEKKNMFPVLLPARFFRASSTLKDILTFESFAYSISSSIFHPSFTETFSQQLFSQMLTEQADFGNLIVILDGFDELIASDARTDAINCINRFLLQHPNTSLFITSRPGHIIKKEIETESFLNVTEIELEPFTKTHAYEYCKKWHMAVFSGNPKKANNYSYVFSQLESKMYSQLEYMEKSPFLLSNLLRLSIYSGRLPTRMIDVYNRTFEMMVDWATQVDAGLNRHDLIIQLAYIANAMTNNHQYSISRAALENVLSHCFIDLTGYFVEPVNTENLPHYVDVFSSRNCVLLSMDNDIFAFPHRQMQEYLTAYAIMNGYGGKGESALNPIDIIRRHYRNSEEIDSSWDEIVLFCVLLGSNRFAHAVTSELINLSIAYQDKSNSSNHYNDLLFSFILGGVILSSRDRYRIYERCFEKSITNKQISDICDIISINSRLFVEIEQFAETKLRNSINQEGADYVLLLSVIRCAEIIQAQQSLVSTVQSLLDKGDSFSSVLGFTILDVASWCKVTRTASDQFRTVWAALDEKIAANSLCVLFSNAVHSYQTTPLFILKRIISSLRQCVLADWISSNSVTEITSSQFTNYLMQKGEDDEDRLAILKQLLDVWPIPPYWDYPHYLQISAPHLVSPFLDDFRNSLSKKESDTTPPVFAFNRCMALGVWDKVDDALDAFDAVLCTPYEAINEDGARIEQVTFSMMYSYCSIIGNNDAEGLKVYVSSKISELSYENLNSVLKERRIIYPNESRFPQINGIADLTYNNFGYLTRRNEIKCQIKRGSTLEKVNPSFFLAPFANRNNPFILMNYALYKAGFTNGKKGKYDIGLRILRKNLPLPTNTLSAVFDWWWEVAGNGELEGLVVLLWLYQIAALRITDDDIDISPEFGVLISRTDIKLILDLFEDKICDLGETAINAVNEIKEPCDNHTQRKIFISYSHDDDKHKNWVKKFASDLSSVTGFHVTLDQTDLQQSESTAQFMERSIKDSDYVFIVCTPSYKVKADKQEGGVGFEAAIITGDIFNKINGRNKRKYIPVLARGSWKNSIPSWAKELQGADMRTKESYVKELPKLLQTIANP